MTLGQSHWASLYNWKHAFKACSKIYSRPALWDHYHATICQIKGSLPLWCTQNVLWKFSQVKTYSNRIVNHSRYSIFQSYLLKILSCIKVSNLMHVLVWPQLWQLKLKCKYLHFGPAHHHGLYYLDGISIDTVTSHNDLRILFDDKLKFHDHITTDTKKPIKYLNDQKILLNISTPICCLSCSLH